MEKKRERRKLKNYLFVNKAQFTIFFSNLILLLLVMGLFVFFVLGPFYSDMMAADDIYKQNLSSKYFILLMERSVYVFCSILTLLFIQQAVIIHRICGPFIPFKRILDNLSAGDLSRRIYLRRHDFFQKEAAQINESLEALANVVATVAQHQQSIEAVVAACETSDLPEPARNALEKINADANQSRKALARFKVLSLPSD